MPIGNQAALTPVLNLFTDLKPQTVLDLGVGTGTWGLLFREYSDIMWGRYRPDDWTIRIDGLEGFVEYRNPAYDYFYDHIYYEDVRDFVPPLVYDLVYAGDIIEHLTEEEVRHLVEKFQNSTIIVTTPHIFVVSEEDYMGNALERHKSFWPPEKLTELGFEIVQSVPVIGVKRHA